MFPEESLNTSTASNAGRNEFDSHQKYKEVVVVGNGPSAISLSYILSGNWPYYGLEAVHPLEFLHQRLASNRSVSLLLQDLCSVCDGLEGRSDNPVSVLFDSLNHPDADLGVDISSCLSWVNHPEYRLEHVVIGRGLPGGSWQSMEQSSLTLSLESWMDLPSYTYREWEKDQMRDRTQCSSLKRATVGHVAQYYRDFVKAKKLESSFRNHCVVTSVRKLSPEQAQEVMSARGRRKRSYWEVVGHSTWDQLPFRYVTPHVVLANGSNDEPNRLRVPGEDLSFVSHYSSNFENLIIEERLGAHSDPVLVVGAGLTAADAIITARFFGVPVAHVFRRDINDPALVFNRLPENMYPDYHKIYQMMGQRESRSYRGYQSYAKHRLVEILPDHKVRIQGLDSSLVIKVSLVLILIGAKPNFSFLDEETLSSLRDERLLRDVLRVDPFTHQSFCQQGLFALGPLVGDNFVRFLQGGALAIAAYLAKRRVAKLSVDNQRAVETAMISRSVEEKVDVAFQWNRVLSCPEGIEVQVDGAQLLAGEGEIEQSIEMLQRRCRFRSGSKRRQQARRRRASHSSCDKLNGAL